MSRPRPRSSPQRGIGCGPCSDGEASSWSTRESERSAGRDIPGREGFVVIQFVEHEEAFRIECARPSGAAPKARDAHPLRKMFVRMPIAELRTLLGADVPPHGDCGL